MSAYKVIECKVQKAEHIVLGLVDMGIPREMIEVYEQAIPLHNYSGRQTGQKANVVVRRQNFKTFTRASYNADLGFEKTEDGYKTHINQEEESWWRRREPRFKQITAAEHTIEQARKRGYHLKKVEKDNKIRLRLTKNF